MRALHRLVLIGLATGMVGCGAAAPDGRLDPAAVESQLREFEAAHRAAIRARDAAVLEFYAPDLVTISPGEPVLHGREWIAEVLPELFRDAAFDEDFRFVDIRVHGDVVAASYVYTQRMTAAGGGVEEITGKGLALLTRSPEGAWRFAWNAYAADPPAQREEP
jgi:uncharacterized protein (TIGR02246 family)